MFQFGRFLRFWSPFHEPMSNRASLFRFGILFMLIFLISLLPCVKAANAQEILPLSQIKSGDRGYGLTVFRGEEPERFNFEVLGTLDYGIAKYIVVALSGGPTDENGIEIIKDGNVFGGMSGSPLYVDGKIIGAVSITGQFLKKPQALVTPIELMVNFKTTAFNSLNNLLDNLSNAGFFEDSFVISGNVQQLKAGDSYMACEIWDDNSDFCAGPGGTVTMVDPKDPKIFYSLGHSGLGQNGIAGVPFWKAEVITTMPSIALSQKLLKRTGPMLGAVIFNGPFGQIAKFGATPPSVPLTIKIVNNFRGMLARKYFFAYSPDISANIFRALSDTGRLIDNAFDIDAEVRIDIPNFPQIYFKGTSRELPAVGLIANVFSKYAAIPNIENITVALSARPKYDVLELKNANLESITENNNKLDLELTLLAGNGDFFTNTLKTTVDKRYLGKKISIGNGGEVASKILSSLGPSKNTANLLNNVADRNALYLYYTDGEDGKKPHETSAIVISITEGSGNGADVGLSQKELPASGKEEKPSAALNKKENVNLIDGWKIQPPETPVIEILSKINLPSENHLIKGSKDIVLTLVLSDIKPQPLQQKRKRKFWIF